MLVGTRAFSAPSPRLLQRNASRERLLCRQKTAASHMMPDIFIYSSTYLSRNSRGCFHRHLHPKPALLSCDVEVAASFSSVFDTQSPLLHPVPFEPLYTAVALSDCHIFLACILLPRAAQRMKHLPHSSSPFVPASPLFPRCPSLSLRGGQLLEQLCLHLLPVPRVVLFPLVFLVLVVSFNKCDDVAWVLG